MSKQRTIIISTFILILTAGAIGFYKFMTYDRKYNWSKEFETEIKIVASDLGYNIAKVKEIKVENIKLPKEKALKLHIQKALSEIKIANYPKEFGQSIVLNSGDSTRLVNCKGWCLGDHLIGVEIEYENIDKNTLNKLKNSIKKQFVDYEIIWTQL
jgi:hypothetical protein